MTLIAACLSALLTFVIATGLTSVGHAASADARVQMAADAAALAAVAESGPGGSGQPASAAHRYAELNGARVVSCICAAGATAVQVTVAIGDIEATARAEIDPSLLGPVDVFANLNGLNPELSRAVTTLIEASRGAVRVVSGYRSHDEQARLWAEALATYHSAEAADDWVARPGESLHERGLAVDLGGDLLLAQGLIDSLGLGLVRPFEDEPWHFELTSVIAPRR